MNICFYHNADHDGKTSAAIVKKVIPDVKLIGINYGDKFPWDSITQEDTVYMVDFSLEPIDRMVHLQSKCGKLIWIDHHISQIKEAERVGFNPDGIRLVGKSGCELTWEYLFKEYKCPIIIRLLGRYDVWDHSDTRAIICQYGMLIEDTDPENDQLWAAVFNNDEELVKRVFSQGEIIYRYQTVIDEELAKTKIYEINFLGHNTLIINAPRCSSLLFDSIWDQEKHDLMMCYSIKPEGVSISFYTDKPGVDVSILAKRFGGGGHAGAAGCLVKSVTKFLKLIGIE